MPTTNQKISGETYTSYSTKETAQAIREALKKAFPRVKFSVRTSYASMTSSTSIRWTDGPTAPEVERITDNFTSRGFDGMTDSTTYHDQIVDGQRVQYSGWVHVTRIVSPSLLQRALDRLNVMRAEYGLPAADVTVQPREHYSFVDGPDANKDCGVCMSNFRYSSRTIAEAVQNIAHHLRANGCLVFMKR